MALEQAPDVGQTQVPRRALDQRRADRRFQASERLAEDLGIPSAWAAPDTLPRSVMRGVDVIVSAVQGGPEVIVDGQVALAEAGRRNGVRCILPSDYALDLFKAMPGEHMMFDLRRAADERIAATGVEHVHVLQGAFMEMFGPGLGTFDHDAGVVAFWGDGTQPIEATSVEDTAMMVARVALDRTVRSGKFAFASDRITILGTAEVIEAQTGRAFDRRTLGSEADLRAAMAEAHKDTSDPSKAVMLAYRLYMLTGQTALSGLQNDRYPDLELESFARFAARALSLPGAGPAHRPALDQPWKGQDMAQPTIVLAGAAGDEEGEHVGVGPPDDREMVRAGVALVGDGAPVAWSFAAIFVVSGSSTKGSTVPCTIMVGRRAVKPGVTAGSSAARNALTSGRRPTGL